MPPFDCVIPIYAEASWKGIPFHVESSDDTFGRRGDSYEFPLSEVIAYKDLGRKQRRFRVKGYLIGGDQVELSVQMARAAESREPGTLVHPMYGRQQVACVSCSLSADYRKEKRRTELDFDFIEASFSAAPYAASTTTVPAMFDAGSLAIEAAIESGEVGWDPTTDVMALVNAIALALANQIEPAGDSEDAFDLIDMLRRSLSTAVAPPVYGVEPEPEPIQLGRAVGTAYSSALYYTTFDGVIEPIMNGTAQIRILHDDARARLMTFNAAIVDTGAQAQNVTSVESYIMAARLSMIRDFTLVALQTNYRTVKEALDDLDWIIKIYDEEEEAAAARGDDKLVIAIRAARAKATQGMLAINIRLPGLVDFNVDGVWTSLTVAHKLYADGRRYEDVEHYAPTMPPWFIGRTTVAPADVPSVGQMSRGRPMHG